MNAGEVIIGDSASSSISEGITDNHSLDLDAMEVEYNADEEHDPTIDDTGLKDVFSRVGLGGAQKDIAGVSIHEGVSGEGVTGGSGSEIVGRFGVVNGRGLGGEVTGGGMQRIIENRGAVNGRGFGEEVHEGATSTAGGRQGVQGDHVAANEKAVGMVLTARKFAPAGDGRQGVRGDRVVFNVKGVGRAEPGRGVASAVGGRQGDCVVENGNGVSGVLARSEVAPAKGFRKGVGGDRGVENGTGVCGAVSGGGLAPAGNDRQVGGGSRGVSNCRGVCGAVSSVGAAGGGRQRVDGGGNEGAEAGAGLTGGGNGDGVAYVVDNQIKAVGKVDHTRKILHGHKIKTGFLCVQLTYVQSQDIMAPLILGDKDENSFLRAGMFFVLPISKLFRLGKFVAGDKVVLQSYVP